MKDVFDEDLMKELGLDPDDIAAVKQTKDTAAAPLQKPAQPPSPPKAAVPPKKEVTPAPQPAAPAPQAKPAAPKPAASVPVVENSGEKVTQNVPVHVAAVMAKKTVSLKDVIEMRPGEVIDFKKSPQEPIDLVVNGKLVAKAELVLVDGRVGARILKLVR